MKHYVGKNVEIRAAGPKSTKFVVWDADTGQVFANEKFSSVREAVQFIADNGMVLINN